MPKACVEYDTSASVHASSGQPKHHLAPVPLFVQVTLFYTAPTAIRALHAKGDAYVTRHSRKSLRLLGSVGEPINPEAWRWYYQVVGDSR